jgi:hypothetical protein
MPYYCVAQPPALTSWEQVGTSIWESYHGIRTRLVCTPTPNGQVAQDVAAESKLLKVDYVRKEVWPPLKDYAAPMFRTVHDACEWVYEWLHLQRDTRMLSPATDLHAISQKVPRPERCYRCCMRQQALLNSMCEHSCPSITRLPSCCLRPEISQAPSQQASTSSKQPGLLPWS